jgi:nucleoid-associated protein Lsr2
MAVKTIRVDNFDGETAANPVEFGYKGRKFVIDVGPENEQAFDDAMKVWIDAAEEVGKNAKKVSRSNGVSMSDKERKQYLADVRDWCKKKKIALNTRGRIPNEILDQYAAEHDRELATV